MQKFYYILVHIIISESIRVDPSKTDGMTKMSVPQSLTELQKFLGMVNYLGKFVPNLAEVTVPLRVLLKKDVVFNLQKLQLGATEKLKILITSAPFLKIFDPSLQTKLKIDTSSEGLGAPLQENHGLPENVQWYSIEHASWALRDYEKRYVQIEKEALSIVFGVERFHQCLSISVDL